MMNKPYVVNLPGGIVLKVEMKDRPVDMEIVTDVGTIVFHRDQGPESSVKGTVNVAGISAANYKKHLRADRKIDKHEVFTASGDSITFSDPEM